MKKVIAWLSGKKVYAVAVAGVIVGILWIAGITTPEQMTGWGKVIGEAMIFASAAAAAFRSALKRVEAAVRAK